MFVIVLFILSIFLLYQCLTCFGFIPLYNITFFSETHVIVMFLHSCICKWGIIFSIIGIFLTIYYLFNKKSRTIEFKNYIVKYVMFYSVLSLLSII